MAPKAAVVMTVIIGMLIVFIYAVLGGMKGITYTQVAQYCVLIFAYLVPAIFISILLTNSPFPQIGFGGTYSGEGGGYLLDKLDGSAARLFNATSKQWFSSNRSPFITAQNGALCRRCCNSARTHSNAPGQDRRICPYTCCCRS